MGAPEGAKGPALPGAVVVLGARRPPRASLPPVPTQAPRVVQGVVLVVWWERLERATPPTVKAVVEAAGEGAEAQEPSVEMAEPQPPLRVVSTWLPVALVVVPPPLH